ncbi:MAG: DUF6036 family nucleotidyltransferase [Bryobacteraceae bacterium]
MRLLSDRLRDMGIVGEINIFGGTSMVLAFQARQSTKDVDAIFAPANEVREAARSVAGQLDLPIDWLNDAVKGFVSERSRFEKIEGLEFSNLRVQTPIAEYLLAMKVMAARAGLSGERGDGEDFAFLIERLKLKNSDDVLEIVQYYNPAQILPRSVYLVDEIFDERRRNAEDVG